MRWTEKEMCKHFGHKEDHQWRHYNNALGVKVESKEHFKHLLEKGNYIPYDVSCQQVEKNVENQRYKGISKKAEKFCHNVKGMADNKGNIKWGSKLIDGMKKEVGLDYSYYKTLPKYYDSVLDTDNGGMK